MTDEEPSDVYLHGILSTVRTSIKSENFRLSVDPNQGTIKGFLSQFYTGTCTNKDNGEIKHIAVKVVPLSRHLSSYQELFKNEFYFYTSIFPELRTFQKIKMVKNQFLNIPRYLGAHLKKNQEFIMMENLRAAGYESFDHTKFLPSEYLEYIFKVYGKFHALSFVYKSEHPELFREMTSELKDIWEILDEDNIIKSVEASYLAVICTFDHKLEANIVEKLKNGGRNVEEILKNTSNYKGTYACLVHGDCKLSNMLFKHKESGELEDIKLIDFQLMSVTTPVHDLSPMFYLGAAKADIDKLDYYLEVYYDSFSAFVTELGQDPQHIYPFKVLKEEWKKYALMGIIIAIWGGMLMDRNEVISLVNKKHLPADEYFKFWNSKTPQFFDGTVFRERARDICLHAVEYGIL